MDKETLRYVITDQEKSTGKSIALKKLITRDSHGPLNLKNPTALVILGVRRSGKSTLSKQLFLGEKFGYVNFDDERLLGVNKDDLNAILQIFYELYGSDLERIVLDEVQLVPGWEPFVSRMRDSNIVIITGSSSKLLSGELSSRLTGRHVDFLLFPFSFREFLKYKGWKIPSAFSTVERAEIVNLLEEYLFSGGFPEHYVLGKQIITNVYNDIVTKDVVQRHKIKHRDDLRQVARFLINNSSNEFTYASLKKITRIKSVVTLTNWVRYLEEAYLIFEIERFSFKLKQIINAPKKIYSVDNGIIRELSTEQSPNKGRYMENVVAIQLMRYCKNQDSFEVFYWKDHRGREVDFVIKRGNKILQLVQVTFASSPESISSRELESLVTASTYLKCDMLTVITWDYGGKLEKNGKTIEFIPLWKWLLLKSPLTSLAFENY
ncbi:MAG: ATP-binding protein [Candidatus Thermoplasmatota archaeon]|nr:ATP-binding protein [Candidatus Thermoplasmatota archaeon]MCL6002462.1 ATP-binding protein [Candidatus Thermoplasmatota archaeon]